ncbi:rRNA maturation RNase YbeY [Tundrisphaera sp. TA3]|uniref:rRNA maturation RNase YbeY n=1 Tax=Tundrisphaera sp. TA3 TaxID=3435775 RepID=UPI003EB9D245
MEIDHTPPNTEIEVEISDGQRFLRVDHADLSALVRRTLTAQGVDAASISIALVDDPTIHAINRRHLAHDWPTDVISFVLSEPDEPVLSGELVVSAEMAATTAREAGADPNAELALYVVHGLLHLCGLDDRDESDAAIMRRREAEILEAHGLTNPFPLVGPTADAGREDVRCDR